MCRIADPHGTMSAELPATRRYVQHHPLDAPGTNTVARELGVDGIPELWFDDIAARTIAYESPRIAECNVDSENFIGAVTRLVTEPCVIIGPPADDAVARVIVMATGAPLPHWPERMQTRLARLPGLVGHTSHRLIEQAPAPNSKIAALVLPVGGIAEAVFTDEAALLTVLPDLVDGEERGATAVFRVKDYTFV